jgi:protein SCO1/2
MRLEGAMSPRTARFALVVSAFVAGLAISLAAVLWLVNPRLAPPGAPPTAAIGGPFRLLNQHGRTVTDADLKGHPFLVFFGFTHCPDVCPTTLFEISEVLRELGPDADRLGALFITVDPERDTPAALKDYLSSFDPHLMGLTGDPEAVAAAVKAYRVYFKKVPLDDGGYTMDHTAIVYLMDKEGRFVAPFSLRRTTEAAVTDLRKRL